MRARTTTTAVEVEKKENSEVFRSYDPEDEGNERNAGYVRLSGISNY